MEFTLYAILVLLSAVVSMIYTDKEKARLSKYHRLHASINILLNAMFTIDGPIENKISLAILNRHLGSLGD